MTKGNEDMNLFEYAVRNKLRFATSRGPLTVEDLFDIPLESRDNFNLDKIAITAVEELRALETTPTSFVKRTSSAATKKHKEAGIRLDIVKTIIDERIAAAEAAQARAAQQSKRRVLEDMLEQKQLESLGALTVEEIQAQLAALN